MAYTHTTQAQAKTQLAARLGDPNKVFWFDNELEVYLHEALRTWAGMALPFRDRETLGLVAGQAFYSTVGASGLTQTVTDTSLARTIEYHLMEPPTSGAWVGTEEYSLAQIQAAISNRLNQLIAEAGFRYTTTAVAVGALAERVMLPEAVVEVVRAEWIDSSGARSPVWRSDGLQNQGAFPGWPLTSGTPLTFSEIEGAPLQLTLSPLPADAGSLSLVVIESHAALDLTSGVVLAIPDDLTPVVKWGALADLLSDHRGADAARAQYCEQRWKEGVELARMYPAVLLARLAAGPAPTSTLFELDSLLPGWGAISGTPTTVALVSYDLLAVYPVPSAPSTITLDVVRKAQLPSSDSDYLQVAKETVGPLLDYAQHLALFKVGGREFLESQAHYGRLLELAASQNDRLRARAEYFEYLKGATRRHESEQPRRKEA